VTYPGSSWRLRASVSANDTSHQAGTSHKEDRERWCLPPPQRLHGSFVCRTSLHSLVCPANRSATSWKSGTDSPPRGLGGSQSPISELAQDDRALIRQVCVCAAAVRYARRLRRDLLVRRTPYGDGPVCCIGWVGLLTSLTELTTAW